MSRGIIQSAIENKIVIMGVELREFSERPSEAFTEWLAHRPKTLAQPGLLGAYSFDSVDGNKVANAADPSKPATAIEGPTLVEGHNGKAAALSGENGFNFPGV